MAISITEFGMIKYFAMILSCMDATNAEIGMHFQIIISLIYFFGLFYFLFCITLCYSDYI